MSLFRTVLTVIVLCIIPVAARSKEWVYGRSLVGLRVRIPPGAWMFVFVFVFVSVVCCVVR